MSDREKLLSIRETMALFGLKSSAFYHYLPRLKAWGLQAIKFGKKGQKFRASSIDRCIKKMAEAEVKLV
jgi:predicted DNA-binding transcriptional regulator AlpA